MSDLLTSASYTKADYHLPKMYFLDQTCHRKSSDTAIDMVSDGDIKSYGRKDKDLQRSLIYQRLFQSKYLPADLENKDLIKTVHRCKHDYPI